MNLGGSLLSSYVGNPFMRRALRLASRGIGLASPNPMVGAVVVREGRVVGEGAHFYAERHHAERVAIDRSGAAARGADLYVTLEPCAHHGRTPPCCEAVKSAGVRRVWVGMEDPNPLTAGKGVDYLKREGVEVHVIDDPAPFRFLNRAYCKLMESGRPWVTMKAAMTLDGRIATASGKSKWITGPLSRMWAHWLRFGHDAVLAGVGTVLADDPELTCRHRRQRENPVVRVVLDSRLRTPASSRAIASADRSPLRIYCSRHAALERREILESMGARVVCVPSGHQTGGGGREEVSLERVLEDLAANGVSSLLVEGGAQVHAAFLRAGAVDECRLFYAPMILGGDAIPVLGELGKLDLGLAIRARVLSVRRLPPDFMVHGIFSPSAR